MNDNLVRLENVEKVFETRDGLVEVRPLEASARRQTREQQAMGTADL